MVLSDKLRGIAATIGLPWDETQRENCFRALHDAANMIDGRAIGESAVTREIDDALDSVKFDTHCYGSLAAIDLARVLWVMARAQPDHILRVDLRDIDPTGEFGTAIDPVTGELIFVARRAGE